MQDATKTTLTDLLQSETRKPTLRERLGVAPNSIPLDHPLVANSTDDIIDFGDTQNLTPPLPGEYWPGQGGIFVGTLLDGDAHYHIVMATQAFEGEWGTYGTEIEGVFSYSNGQHNTQLILAAEPKNELLLAITRYEADGHSDFYLPANFENNLIAANAQKHVEKKWHWSSTQYSAHTAWSQHFGVGRQGIYLKDNKLAARAVRRVLVI